MFRFLHLADLHLSSPLAAFRHDVAERWRGAQFAALESLLDTARDAGAALFLFAGDVFDSPHAAREDVARFYRILEATGVPSVIAPGNHDFYIPDGAWHAAPVPANVCLFTDRELGYFDFPEPGVTVYGFAFRAATAKAPALGIASDRPEGRLPLLLAHGDITSPVSPYAPIPTGALAASGFAYAALGHIHNPPEPARFGQTLAAYSGFFGGRGFDELGAGHALFCTVQEGAVRTEKWETAAPQFLSPLVDCTGVPGAPEVRERIADFLAAQNFPALSAVRLRLGGEVGVGCTPRRGELLPLGEDFAFFDCTDETVPLLDGTALSMDMSLRGAFYRALLPSLQSENATVRRTAAKALRIGFAALDGKEAEL